MGGTAAATSKTHRPSCDVPVIFFFSSRRRHTRWNCDWSSDVCSSDLGTGGGAASDLAGTPALIGASASAGPWPLVYGAAFALGTHKYQLNTVGRDSAQADVEILQLVAGRWVEGPGEIVVTRAFADFNRVRLGDRLLSLGSLEKPALVVVGEAVDIDEGGAELSTQSAWVAPSQLPLLAPDWGYTMVYRFAQAPTA